MLRVDWSHLSMFSQETIILCDFDRSPYVTLGKSICHRYGRSSNLLIYTTNMMSSCICSRFHYEIVEIWTGSFVDSVRPRSKSGHCLCLTSSSGFITWVNWKFCQSLSQRSGKYSFQFWCVLFQSFRITNSVRSLLMNQKGCCICCKLTLETVIIRKRWLD